MFRNKETEVEMADRSPSNKIEPSRNRTRTFVVAGLALGMLMAAMNQTIIGTSIPSIVSELGGMVLYPWLFTAYILAEVITIPIAGKMSDRFGRRPVFLTGVLLFLGGTILASAATSMEMLIAFMFVQGLGAGIIMPVSMATVADLYPPSELGKMQGMLGAVFALASVIGPLLGGLIVDSVSWRIVYWIVVPMGILALAVTITKFPKPVKMDSPKRIDFLGMASFTISLATFLLVLTWGGTTYAWESIEIVSLCLVSIVALAVFIRSEQRAKDPILPLRLFKSHIFTLSMVGLMVVGLGLFGVVSFLPMFQQAVLGMSASNSGVTLIPLMLGLMLTTIVSGLAIKRTGYKIWLLAGPPVAALGLYLLSTLGVGSSQIAAIAYTFLIGLGLGMLVSNYIVATQNVASKEDIGVVSGSLTLFRSLGGAIGVALLGSVVNRQMIVELGNNLPAGAAAVLPATDANTLGGLLLNSVAATQIPLAMVDAIRLSLSNSMTYMFLMAAGIVLSVTLVNVFIKNLPLKGGDEHHEGEPEGMSSICWGKKILVPTDGSRYGRSAIEHALEISKLTNTEVTALTVIDTTKVTSTLQNLAPAPSASSMAEWADPILGEATAMAKKKGVKMTTKVLMGDPATIINDMSGNYCLIVMGTKGLHGLPHMLLGSVAEKVTRGSKCPVMVVRTDQRGGETATSSISKPMDAADVL